MGIVLFEGHLTIEEDLMSNKQYDIHASIKPISAKTLGEKQIKLSLAQASVL